MSIFGNLPNSLHLIDFFCVMSFVIYRDDGHTKNLEPNVLVYIQVFIFFRHLLMNLTKRRIFGKGNHCICL